MSTNIYIKAVRDIFVPAINKHDTQQVYFKDKYQTPTKVSYAIRDSSDPIATYKDWALTTFTETYKEPIYAEDDYTWDEDAIVGYKEVKYAEEHCNRLDEWVKGMQEKGYRIEVECW